jgi:hypothetical protein
MNPVSNKLAFFLSIFEKDIAPFYERHEHTFDQESFHGRFHILRCLFLVDKIDRFYRSVGLNYDIDRTYYAVLFHDIARQGNGWDEWEEESAERCYSYLLCKEKSEEEARTISCLILKEIPFTLEGQILYDVDVLDYNRFFTFPFHQNLFDENRLIIGSEKDCTGIIEPGFRRHLIHYAQKLVQQTETIPITNSTNDLIKKFLEVYEQL